MRARAIRTSVAVSLGIAALGLGCAKRGAGSKEGGKGTPSSGAALLSGAGAPSSAAVAAPPGRLSTPTAFELTASPRGATLIWAPLERAAGAVQKRELDPAGAVQANSEVALASGVDGDVADLTASWVGSRLGLAWLERKGAAARVRAAWAGASSAPFELGAAWSGPRLSRGNLVMAARGDKALVFARGSSAACIDPGKQQNCFAFGFHELEATRAVPTGLPMSVPVPCNDNSTALAVVGERFHYGVCTESASRPVTTLFSIQRDPEYARADTLLEGCTPYGTFVWRSAAWLVAECEGGRRAARIGDDPQEFLDLHGLRLECRSGQMRVRAPSLDLALEEPRSGLAPLLPPDVAPVGARAAWAGRALLVATSFSDTLRLTRRSCNGDRLETVTLFPSVP
ncbi:MAG TPA: hypothetical protein VNN72_07315 [Polyangiaceae bacterium]|nr:hypothetical protein [Polyangiaceae bacterium]